MKQGRELESAQYVLHRAKQVHNHVMQRLHILNHATKGPITRNNYICVKTPPRTRSTSVKLSWAVSQFEPQMPALEINFQFLHTSSRGKTHYSFNSVENPSEILVAYL